MESDKKTGEQKVLITKTETMAQDQEAENARKQRIKAQIAKLVGQMKSGCKKSLCFNRYCKKNQIDIGILKFNNDQEMLKNALSLFTQSSDPSSLICSDGHTLDMQRLKSDTDPKNLVDVIEDVHLFCCSFVKTVVDQEMSVDEVSAFDEEAQEKLKNQPSEVTHLQIDFDAVRQFFKLLLGQFEDKKQFSAKIQELLELIIHEWENNFHEPEKSSYPKIRTMCIRGLVMLLHLEQISDYDCFKLTFQLLETLNQFYSYSRQQADAEHEIVVKMLMQLPREYIHEYVMSLQNLLTINIISSLLNLELLEQTVVTLDMLHFINRQKSQAEQISALEFQNDAINENVDLKPTIHQWVKITKQQLQNKKAIQPDTKNFNICSYPWILNTANKAFMLQQYNKFDWAIHQDVFLMRSFWDRTITAQNYVLEVNRDRILEDSLKKIVQVSRIEGKDPLRLPLKIQFEKEPGIDIGGVRKEYFSLIMRELFNPAFGMFKFNEDVQLYWFNGSTFEPNINFELVGTLMGLAFYNNMFVDMPVVPACYKILLDREPDLHDLAKWQPETAKSLQFILDYDESKNGFKKLEEIVGRSFTVDFEQFGQIQEIELIPNGKNIQVSQDNKEQFVRLFIEYEFKKQCAPQLASFKRGFERMVDIQIIKTTLSPDDLEQLICGQRTLDFLELRDYCVYANGFNPQSQLVTWFWEIVLDEWTDEQRRKLLSFSTGSDRAPVNGLKAMKFFIVKDEVDDDMKLPSSHTCFNQLVLPNYSSKDILRQKLMMAIDNSTGFGMV